MSRRSITALVVSIALLLGGLAWWFTRAPSVPAVALHWAPLVRSLQFSARVATRSRVDVGSTLTGRVMDVAVMAGSRIKAGDLLVRLESDELRATLAQAQANQRQALARLAGLRSTGRSSAQAGVAQAESVWVAARADLQRNIDLVAQGFVSEARLDEARRAAAVAQALLASARAASAANADNGTDVAQAEALLTVASASTQAAQARLAQAVITAPADARVLSRTVEPGQIVQPGRALLSLALAGPLQLVAQVDERYLEQLQVGQPAQVLADAYPGQRFAAKVLSISPLVDAQRGAIEVKLVLPGPPPDFLREDMTLSIEVETAHRDRALVVPMAALRPAASGSGSAVYVERGGRVEVRTVHTGLQTLDSTELLDGLAEGDLVLIGATPKPGSRVRADLSSPAPKLPSNAGKAGGDAGSAMTNAMGR